MRGPGESQDTIAEPLFHQRREFAALAEGEVRMGKHWSRLCTALQGCAGKVLQAVGVELPPLVGFLPAVAPRPASIPAPLCISITLHHAP